MIRTAALIAAIGTLLLTVMYGVNNVIPILRNLDVVAPLDAALVLFTTIVPTLLWTALFLAIWRKASIGKLALATAILAVGVPIVIQLVREFPTLSLLSVDSIVFVVTELFYAAVWLWLLLRWSRQGVEARAGGVLLLLLVLTAMRGLLEGGPAIASLMDALGGQLATFWEFSPWQAFWRLLAVPLFTVFYWFSQLLFLLAARGSLTHSPARAIT